MAAHPALDVDVAVAVSVHVVGRDAQSDQAAATFVRSGFLHILSGPDHLLFLLLLVAPFRRFLPLAAIVTNGEASLRWLTRPTPDLGEAKSAIGRMIGDGKRASEIIGRIRALATKRAPERARLSLRPSV